MRRMESTQGKTCSREENSRAAQYSTVRYGTVQYLPPSRACCLPVIGDIGISALTCFSKLQEVLLRMRTYLNDCSCLDE